MDALSRLDAAFLQAEDADDTVSMAIASVAVFEGTPPSYDELVRALLRRLHLLPRYYQRVHRFPFDLASPVWVNDVDFDICYHVRRVALPTPAGENELHQLLSRVMAQRLDRDHPLWETWLIENLRGGRWALISKVHHCMVDGIAGTELYHLLFSPTPDTGQDGSDDAGFEPPAAPADVVWLLDAVRRAAAKPSHLAGLILSGWRHPRRFISTAAATSLGLVSLGRVLVPAAQSSLLGPIGRQRRYVSTTVALHQVKQVAHSFGVTVNDVALAVVAAGFRELLLARQETPSPHAVRSLVPTNVRAPGAEGELANRVSCMFADLPVHLADPCERLDAVHALLLAAKADHEAEAGQVLTELSEYEPSAAVSAMLRAAFRMPQRNIVTVATNVPGPQAPLYLLGRKMTRLLPFVPIADRARIGVAILSYCDELTFGVTGDYSSAPDLDVLIAGLREDLTRLLVACGAGSRDVTGSPAS